MREITVGKNDANQRLDKFLSKLMPKLAKNMLYKSLRKNCVRLNGKHIKDGAFMLSEGDRLSLYFADEYFQKPSYSSDFMKISPNLDIVYEDENILLVNAQRFLDLIDDAPVQFFIIQQHHVRSVFVLSYHIPSDFSIPGRKISPVQFSEIVFTFLYNRANIQKKEEF